jgi:glutamate carboxypeptidase
LRAFSSDVYAEAKAALLALAGQGTVASSADGYACSIRPEILRERAPWPRNPGTERLLQIWQQAASDLGLAVGQQERGGLSDGNLTWDVVPTLDGLGPWGDNDHCSERSPDGTKLPEFVSINSFAPKALLNTISIMRLAAQ